MSWPVTVTLSDVEPERVDWLWPDRLPAGKLVTLDGDPAVGKSTVTVDWMARLSIGKPWPDGTECPIRDSLVMTAEDGLADTVRPRVDAAGGDPTRVHALTAVQAPGEDGALLTRPPTLGDIDAIGAAISRHNAGLLVTDVLMAFLPKRADSHKDQDIRAVLARVAQLAEDTRCAVLLLRHLNKMFGGVPLYRGGGSIGIVGAARAGFLIAADPDDLGVHVLASVKSNLAPMPSSLAYRLESTPDMDVARVAWLEGSSRHNAAGLLESYTEEEVSEQDDAAAFIHDYLVEHGGAALARDVQAAGRKRGYSKSTMHRASKRLRVQREKDGMTGPWTWRHPADVWPEGSTEGSEDSTP